MDTNYKIVSASSIEQLEKFVGQNLLLGYKPQGGICAVQRLGDQMQIHGENICTLEDRGIVYLQALVYGKE